MNAEQFWAQVDRSAGPDGCWPWRGCRDANGYGWLRWQGQRARAHRVALVLDGRPAPDAEAVGRHLCHNKPCCNPRHLMYGTQADNVRDSQAAGRLQGRRRLLSAEQAADVRRWYRRGLATSVELAQLFGVATDVVRHIGTDRPYRAGRG